MQRFIIWLYVCIGITTPFAVFGMPNIPILAHPVFGLRVIVVSPTASLPQVRTFIVSRASNMRRIDSAEAYCDRCAFSALWCKRQVVSGIVSSPSTIYWELPFSKILVRLTGASFDDWQQKEREAVQG
jgi:hypothetical protein